MLESLYSQYIKIISNNLFSRTATFLILVFTFFTLLVTILQIFCNWLKSKPSVAIKIQKVDVNTFHRQGDAKVLSITINLNVRNNSRKNNLIHTRILKLEGAKKDIKSLYNATLLAETPTPITFSQVAFALPNEIPQKQYKLTICLIDQHNKLYSSDVVVQTPECYLS